MIGRLCAFAFVLMVASCGGDGASETVASSAPPTSTASTTSIAESDRPVVAVEADPCELVTADEVASATGLGVEEVREEGPIGCLFDLGAEAGVAVFVTVEDGQGRASGPAAVFGSYEELEAQGDAEAIAGLGERALYAPRFRGLAVDVGGGGFIAVGINGGLGALQEPREALIALAEAALGRL
jgi:hypothetical protein